MRIAYSFRLVENPFDFDLNVCMITLIAKKVIHPKEHILSISYSLRIISEGMEKEWTNKGAN